MAWWAGGWMALNRSSCAMGVLNTKGALQSFVGARVWHGIHACEHAWEPSRSQEELSRCKEGCKEAGVDDGAGGGGQICSTVCMGPPAWPLEHTGQRQEVRNPWAYTSMPKLCVQWVARIQPW